MARPSKPWFREQSDSWVSKINGKLCTLAKGKKNRREAEKAFYRLLDGRVDARPVDHDVTIGHLVNLMADDVKGLIGKDRLRFLRLYLPKFLDFVGRTKPASSVSPNDVTRFLAQHPNWSRSTRSAIIGAIKRVFNWGIDEGLLTENPIRKVKRPAYAQRDSCVDAETAGKLIGYFAATPIGVLVEFLHETGCRPSESYRLQVEHINLAQGTCKLPGKTTKATGEDRIIHLTPRAIEILKPLIARYKTGHIFRSTSGSPFTPQRLYYWFSKARDDLGLPSAVTAEAFRHAFATDGASRVQTLVLAALMGHRDTKMLSRYYIHADKRAAEMRAAVESIRGNGKQGGNHDGQ
jgi:integrase